MKKFLTIFGVIGLTLFGIMMTFGIVGAGVMFWIKLLSWGVYG